MNPELDALRAELEKRSEQIAQLNRELAETNQGVMALFAELDDKAASLRRASEEKTSFLSNMTHEFRTPLNSILSLTSMLLDRLDGELTAGQEKQVGYIKRAAEELSELSNDLLDIAKVEAGKLSTRPAEFQLADLFSALRGMLRPLLPIHSRVALVLEDPIEISPLFTDETKLAQILRNFISNALKFTEQGEVRVSAHQMGDAITITVRDTGVGIAPENQKRIFEEFTQIEGPHQKGRKGTGLGLPLSRKLAELLGGSVTVESQLGTGSTFSVTLPRKLRSPSPSPETPADLPTQASEKSILIIDDDAAARYVLQSLLSDSGCNVVHAADGREGIIRATELSPAAIFLDLSMPEMDGFAVLQALKANPETGSIPVIIHSSRSVTPAEQQHFSGKIIGFVSKNYPSRETARAQIWKLLAAAGLALGNDFPGGDREVSS